MTLPTPRAVLTSLLNTITSTTPTVDDLDGAPSNPLSHLPPSIRPLLTTLHVLYPTLLLPALDLLDRSLVTRVIPEHPPPAGDAATKESASFYLVRSAAATTKRNAYAATLTAPYIVHLNAWNCSCANFAYEAFPTAAGQDEDILEPGVKLDDPAAQQEEWQFGGMSLDGREGGGAVPCCKHLLASLLGERWEILGRHMVERRASREEMAGMVLDL